MTDLSERVKTDMRLPRILIQHVEELAEAVGLPKNSFFTVAAAKLAAELAGSFSPGKKRKRLLQDLENEVQRVFKEARETL